MSQISVNIEEVGICKCGYYCRLKTSRTPLNPGRQFFGCKSSKENGGCGYFRWIDLSLENVDESPSMNRLRDSQNPIDRLKRKVKELEEEKDSLKFQLNESDVKLMVLNKKLKEVKLQRD
uniref:GRF-type domain-containing protein n=1 Tax=Solanum lycopersicum TaxID=4081 RepID=A0A3Q7FMM7_SOLLC